MKKGFISLLAILLIAVSISANSQCLTGGSFVANAANTFDASSEGYSGDFSWVSSGSGELQSTAVSAGQTKVFTTTSFYLPPSATTIAWSYDLGGTANVTSYTIEAVYSFGTVAVCSGGALSTVGGNLVFAAAAPSQIIGNTFQLKITFTSTSTGNKVLNVDNFKTNASVASSPITLPVTFNSFNGAITTGAGKLTWLVASETNVNRYEIERSSNGQTFSKIGQVAASGLTTYTYSDATATTGSNYYRIRAVDNDGKYKYSSTVLIKLGKTSLSSTLKVYPMPATNEITLEHAVTTIGSSISVLSVDGKLLKTISAIEGNEKSSINISSLRPGLYLIRYSTADGESATTRLIKQ